MFYSGHEDFRAVPGRRLPHLPVFSKGAAEAGHLSVNPRARSNGCPLHLPVDVLLWGIATVCGRRLTTGPGTNRHAPVLIFGGGTRRSFVRTQFSPGVLAANTCSGLYCRWCAYGCASVGTAVPGTCFRAPTMSKGHLGVPHLLPSGASRHYQVGGIRRLSLGRRSVLQHFFRGAPARRSSVGLLSNNCPRNGTRAAVRPKGGILACFSGKTQPNGRPWNFYRLPVLPKGGASRRFFCVVVVQRMSLAPGVACSFLALG